MTRPIHVRAAICLAWLALHAAQAAADTPHLLMAPTLSPGLQCRQAIAAAERSAHTPPHLLAAIGRIESGRRDPANGTVAPWPWSINVEGQDHVYDTKAEVIAAVRTFQASGIRSIDVGCMQINLMHHSDAFTSLEDAFDPQINAAYAARFLTELFQQTGSWEKATAWYHSATPGIGDDYQRKVAAAMPDEGRLAGTMPSTPFTGPSNLPLRMVNNGAGLQMVLPMDRPRMIPMPSHGGTMAMGRSLDSYRSLPIMLARR